MSALKEGMIWLLEWLYSLTQVAGIETYGFAIILLTILIKMVIYPLSYKQMASMRRLSELQPHVKELQQKYKNDKQKLNQEIMKLYQKYNVNPASGCLPILIQLPIFIALYQSLLHFPYPTPASAEFFGFNLSTTYGLTGGIFYLTLPILAGLTTFLQTKVSSPNATSDPTQRTMLYFMPFFLAYITASVPSGLGVYWVTMNVMSILQQLYINKKLAEQKGEADAA